MAPKKEQRSARILDWHFTNQVFQSPMSAVSSKENGKIPLKQRNFFFLISWGRVWAALGRGGSACWTWREQEHLKPCSKIRDGALFLQVYSWISIRAWIQPWARRGFASLHAAAQQQTRSSETTAGIMSSCEEELGNPATTSFQTLSSSPSSSSTAEELGEKKKQPGPGGWVWQKEIPLQDVPISIPEGEELRCRVERGGSASLAVVHLPDSSCLQEKLCAAKGDVIPSPLLKSNSLLNVAQGWCY